MTKQHFIALADAIRKHNQIYWDETGPFTTAQICAIADFCQSQNSNFKRDRWLSYVAGECGPNGGAIKAAKQEVAV